MISGEKQSVLKKLFGRNKTQQNDKKNRSKDSETYTSVTNSSTEHQQETANSEEKHEVELATFSAQFPPPEWQWYESQQNHQQIQAVTEGLHPHLLGET